MWFRQGYNDPPKQKHGAMLGLEHVINYSKLIENIVLNFCSQNILCYKSHRPHWTHFEKREKVLPGKAKITVL